MKIIFLILILILFCAIGYLFKEKYKKQKLILEHIDDFLMFYKSKIVISKNNIVEIINEYKIMQNNKNANLQNIFQNNNNLFNFNENLAKRYIFDEKLLKIIVDYFENIGAGNQNFEIEKINSFSKIIKEYLNKTSQEIKTKGEISFKISIALGLVVLIILW